MVHWSPFVMSFKKKYPWIQLAGHAGTEPPPPNLPAGPPAPSGGTQHAGGAGLALDAPGDGSIWNSFSETPGSAVSARHAYVATALP